MCTLIFFKNLIFLNLTSPKVPLSEQSMTQGGGKTAESRYLIFKTELFKLYWAIGPEILPFASLKCHKWISMPLFTDQAHDQTWSVANREHVTILGLFDTRQLSPSLWSNMMTVLNVHVMSVLAFNRFLTLFAILPWIIIVNHKPVNGITKIYWKWCDVHRKLRQNPQRSHVVLPGFARAAISREIRPRSILMS